MRELVCWVDRADLTRFPYVAIIWLAANQLMKFLSKLKSRSDKQLEQTGDMLLKVAKADTNGKLWTIGDLEGKRKLISIWASWFEMKAPRMRVRTLSANSRAECDR